MLPNDKKAMIAGELDRSMREIERKISVRKLLCCNSQCNMLILNAGHAHKSGILSFCSYHSIPPSMGSGSLVK